ncbi:MAG: HEAT repeat domain-containing protein [Anaeromyxobacter sp.]
MKRLAVAALLGTLAVALAADMVETAIAALQSDPSLKVRTQAALILGSRKATQAVPALSEAVERDDSAAVRIAAASALGKIKDPGGRGALEHARDKDPDASVRTAAAKALEALAPAPVPAPPPSAPGATAFSIEEPGGAAGGPSERRALRDALTRYLTDRGYAVVPQGGMTLKPSVVALDVKQQEGKTVISVRAGLLAVEGSGRMAAMLDAGAKLSATGKVPDGKLAAYSAKALDAAARTLCDDLASRLSER